MAKEPDQTRWVGIRPTDPSENIPVTESAPLTDILVSPLAAGTEFKTLTKKRSPATADAAAIGAMVAISAQMVAVAGNNFFEFATVPANKIWKILAMNAFCDTGNPTTVRFFIKPALIRFYFFDKAYGAAWTHCPWDGEQWADETFDIGCLWCGCVANDLLTNTIIGYQVDKYV